MVRWNLIYFDEEKMTIRKGENGVGDGRSWL